MPGPAQIKAEAARLLAAFVEAGAELVEADILLPAETLLDLYGEDIRSRAYVTADPLRGEMLLRPDFTVPVVQAHMAGGKAPARYAYAGEVFRKQEHETGRPSEYAQVGFELFDGADPAAADAEVFALFAQLLAPAGLTPATGDIGILLAAIEGLSTTPARKRALLRHIWRPHRFRALLDRFRGKSPVPASRVRMLERVAQGGVEALLDQAGPEIGLRARTEVETRIAALQEDAATPPIAAGEAEILNMILGLRETLPNALSQLRDIAVDMPAIAGAVDRMEARAGALAARGVDVEALDFEASYGRTSLEYYDGFVFGFYVPARPDLPPVASGGRYDALTRVLGGGAAHPAVGGVIRPGLLLSLAEGA